MSTRKETKILPPGYKAPVTSKPSKPAQKPPLSKEIVVESETESEDKSSSNSSSNSGSDREGSGRRSRSPPGKTPEKPDQKGTTAPANVRPTSSSKTLLGYEPVVTAKSGGSKTSDVFSKSNLSGKQIWHITIPSSVPIKSFSEVTLADIEKGKAVATHNDLDYSLSNEQDTFSKAKLMVPSQSNGEYRAVSLDFTKSLHLQLNSGSMSTSHQPEQDPGLNTQERPSKGARKQPKGLRLRFAPAGTRATDADQTGWSSSSEETSAEGHAGSRFHDQFQVPKGLEEPAQRGSREHAEDSQERHRRPGNPTADQNERRSKPKSSHKRDDRSKIGSEGVMEQAVSNPPQPSQRSSRDKNHQGEQERVHKKRKAEPGRDEHVRRRETSVERAKRKKKEKEQRKRTGP
ncbi:MAG: hypothetical protein M1816_008195 [Peltula sp. TS41687]|nr:MAG: hypothetical protein M1816_008195 [Peltula sp. TS41687]